MKILFVLPFLLLAAALICIFTSLGSPPTDILLVGAIATSHFSMWFKIGKIEGRLDEMSKRLEGMSNRLDEHIRSHS